MNISSINFSRDHVVGEYVYTCFPSNLAMNRLAYAGMNLVPMAVPDS